MKRLISFFTGAAVLLGMFCMPAAVAADEAGVSISAPSAVLMDFFSGQVLYEKNSHEQRACASITKVMTLCLVFDAIDSGSLSLDDMLTASAHAASMGGSDIWLKEGESMSVNDLLKATVVMSANDAAVVLAENVAGSEEAFVARMNEKAAALGMDHTVFKNCNGLDEEGHVSCAHDVALMSRELMRHSAIFDYTCIWLDYIRDGATQLVNTNKLIRTYSGITGLKTGTTSMAGSCISATAERDGTSLIAVVLGASSTDERFKDAAALLDMGFENWCSVAPEKPELENVKVLKGMQKEVECAVEQAEPVLLRKDESGAITFETEIFENLTAPVKRGDIIGRVKYVCGEKTVAQGDIFAASEVREISFSSVFEYLLSAFLKL